MCSQLSLLARGAQHFDSNDIEIVNVVELVVTNPLVATVSGCY